MTEPKFKIYQTVYTSTHMMGGKYLIVREIEAIKYDGTNFKYYLLNTPHCSFDEREIFASKEELIRSEISKLNLQIANLEIGLLFANRGD